MDLYKEKRDRLSAESAKVVSDSRQSCRDSAEHINSSRRAIDRSLRLLGVRYHPGFED